MLTLYILIHKRVAQFERFILQHLTAQTDLIAGRRRSSVALTQSASVAGFVPLMAESPDLDAISPDFVELEGLPVSYESFRFRKDFARLTFVLLLCDSSRKLGGILSSVQALACFQSEVI